MTNMLYQQVIQQDLNQQESKTHYGKMIILCSRNDKPSCMLGPQYYILIPAFLLIGTLFILMYIKMYPILLFHWKILLVVAIILFLIAYIMIGLSNPGIVIKRLQSGYLDSHRNDSYFCHVCGVLREKGTRHCEFCDICIKGHDHHCPWIGKCVGAQNKGTFYLFLLMTFATFLIFFIATISSSK